MVDLGRVDGSALMQSHESSRYPPCAASLESALELPPTLFNNQLDEYLPKIDETGKSLFGGKNMDNAFRHPCFAQIISRQGLSKPGSSAVWHRRCSRRVLNPWCLLLIQQVRADNVRRGTVALVHFLFQAHNFSYVF